MKKIVYILSVLLAVFFVSCRSVSDISADQIPVKRIATQRLIKFISENELDYEYLNIAKFAAKYSNGEESKNFKGSLRLKRDSAVFMSISPLMGIEMFRLILQEDSLYFIDRYNKNYFIGDYNFINKKLNFDFDLGLIENVLCGQLYSYNYKKTPEKALKHYKTTIVDNHYILETPDKRRFDEVYCRYTIDSKFRIRSGVMKDLNNGYELRFTYSDYKKFDGTVIPQNVVIDIVNTSSQFSLELDYKKVNLADKLSFPFNVSSRYSKIEIQ